MKIVIDIPDGRYEELMNDDIRLDVPIFKEDIIATIPKGHGRLIDADALKKCKTCQEWNTNKRIDGSCYCRNWHNYTGEDFYCGDWVRKTIIEAESEVENEISG